MSTPLVSVIVPCLNAGPMLRPALQSAIAQTHTALEIVFVDNGSTDGSAETAERTLAEGGRPFRILRCEERGANAGRNLGYRYATGAYVQWLDADDLLDANKVARQVEALEARPDDDIAYGDFTERFLIPGALQGVRKRALAQENDQLFRTLVGAWYPPHLYLVRRAAAERLQERLAWNPSCLVATDREYGCTAALLGMPFLHVPGAHVVYNIWSKAQASQRTPYAVRARTLERVFARLRALAEISPRGFVRYRHQVLLDQDWRVWTLPRGSVSLTKLDGRRLCLRHAGTGRELDLRPREAAVAQALMATDAALTTSHFALNFIGGPKTTDDPILVIETMQKLARAGFLVDVTDTTV